MIEIKNYGKLVVVKINARRIDVSNADILNKNLDEALKFDYILLDVEMLEFIDSSGVGIIISFYKKIKGKKGKFGLVNVNNRIFTILNITGLLKIIKIYKTYEDAKEDYFETVTET
ncbi:MAG: STAS domain-containing protein [Calditerrivibrio sp.]|nr:STAS domain-containing protein [Calditerrivibrio sp.]MCA1933361.1 STAS domain-containing protein [Calditerrivibrio sp.]MCA1980584.1 STAS domain-containing protein [Calditerrivibrio sp.]